MTIGAIAEDLDINRIGGYRLAGVWSNTEFGFFAVEIEWNDFENPIPQDVFTSVTVEYTDGQEETYLSAEAFYTDQSLGADNETPITVWDWESANIWDADEVGQIREVRFT